MVAHLALLFALVASPVAAMGSLGAKGHLPSFIQSMEGAKGNPVIKVINLLKDMVKQLEKEAEEDEEIYEKLACWCTTNDKEKTKAIADAEAHIDDLTSAIEELSASSARLNTEIGHLSEEVKENQDALDEATAMRAKELAEFNEEEKEFIVNIAKLKGAITVLSKVHDGGASFAQTSQQDLLGIAQVINHDLTKYSSMFDGILTVEQKKVVASFVQAPGSLRPGRASASFAQAPASGAIFGILKQMLETFQSNMSNGQKEELQAQKQFEELKAAKEKEIRAGQDLVDTKTQELADTDEKLAMSKKDIEDTKSGLSADEKFLMELKETCQTADHEYEARTATRKGEIEACSKALAFLTSDEARDLFAKTLSPAFVQSKQNSAISKMRRMEAAKILSNVAQKTKNGDLMKLALQVKLDAFEKVKKAIDDMIATLLKEKQEEIKLKDFCRQSFYDNEMAVEEKKYELKNFKKEITDLEGQIGMLEKAIETLKAEVAEMNRQMKNAGEDREKENKEFQMTVADQRATVKLLSAALGVLQGFYGKFLQKSVSAEGAGAVAPPPGFKEYKKSAASGGVMGMIESIIQDAKDLEAEATRAEGEAQTAYEDFVKESQASIDEKSKDIVNKSEEKAKAEEDKTTAEQNKENTLLELDNLAIEEMDLHKTCDFVMKNFDIRQSARDEEIEGLKQAKAILSGAKFIQYLQLGGY